MVLRESLKDRKDVMKDEEVEIDIFKDKRVRPDIIIQTRPTPQASSKVLFIIELKRAETP